jgi:ABC-type phosphate transport system substrate-binding protein
MPPTTTRALSRRRATVLAAAAAGACAGLAGLTATAEAFFAVPRCGGEGITGRGASFQQGAQQGWAQAFSSTVCPGHAPIGYEPTGSGSGRTALGGGSGGSAGVRNPAIRFGASDEGPSTSSQTTMNAGLAGAADDATVRVLPVAAGAVSMAVNYPNDGGAACPIPDGYRAEGATNGLDRLRVPNVRLERAWAGEYATWGDLLADTDGAGPIQGLADVSAACAAKPLVRVVRQDSSGTTFAFKDFLNRARQDLNPGGTNWRTGPFGIGSSTDNRQWPNTRADETDDPDTLGFDTALGGTCSSDYVNGTGVYADNPGNPVCRPGPNGNETANGAGPQGTLLAQTDGAIGYLDLFTAVDRGFLKSDDAGDTTYVMPLAVRGSTTNYVEPTAQATGFQSGQGTGGANCNVSVNDIPSPANGDETASTGWDQTSMVYPASGYGACSLTYLLAFDDNAPVYLNLPGADYATEERRARALKDYLDHIVSNAGQAQLVDLQYSPLPPLVRDIAREGVAAIDWDKANVGNRQQGGGGGGGGGAGGGGTTTTPTTGTTPTSLPPRTNPGAPSNAFTITSARVRGNDVVAALRLPGAGRIVVQARGTYRQRVRPPRRTRTLTRRVTLGQVALSASRAGSTSLRLRIPTRARGALRRAVGRRMSVALRVTYTPQGGAANTLTRTLSVRGRR